MLKSKVCKKNDNNDTQFFLKMSKKDKSLGHMLDCRSVHTVRAKPHFFCRHKISLSLSYKTFERDLRPHMPSYVMFSNKSPSNRTTKQDRRRVQRSSGAGEKRRNGKTCLLQPLRASYRMYTTLKFSWKLPWRLSWHRTKKWFYAECGLALILENFILGDSFSYHW